MKKRLGFDIALTGKTRSGKDTVYEILKELGYNVHRVAFGDELKKRYHETFRDHPSTPKPIQNYIDYGQAMRAIDENVWVKQLARTVTLLTEGAYNLDMAPPNFVITDVRQPNEFKYARDNDFVLVRVVCDNGVRIHRMEALGEEFTPELLTAPTETAQDYERVDYDLYNMGMDRDELKVAVEYLIKQIKEDKKQ